MKLRKAIILAFTGFYFGLNMTQKTFGYMPYLGPEGSSPTLEGEKVTTKQAKYDTRFGRKLMYRDVNSLSISEIGINRIEIVNSGDLDAGDIFTLNLYVTDESTGIETVHAGLTTGVFATSDAVTMGVLLTAIKACTGISAGSAYLTNKLTIIATDGFVIKTDTEAYTGGSTVTLTSKTNKCTNVLSGYAKQNLKMPVLDSSLNQVSLYKANDPMVNVKTAGEMVVYSTDGFDNTKTFYYYGYGDNRGRLVTTNTGNDVITLAATDVKHKVSANAADKGSIIILQN